MDLASFRQLFDESLERAAQNAEARLRRVIPREFIIELAKDVMLSPSDAATLLYIDDEHYYVVIDVAVMEVSRHVTKVYVRSSGHPPVPFDRTWNDPLGSGPFKQVNAINIIESVNS